MPGDGAAAGVALCAAEERSKLCAEELSKAVSAVRRAQLYLAVGTEQQADPTFGV